MAAIAIPRFTGLRHESTVKAEGSTATSIISAARVQEAASGKSVGAGAMTNTGAPGDAGFIDAKYMLVPAAPVYTIGYSGNLLTVSWPTAAGGDYAGDTLTLTEGQEFIPTP